MIPAGLAPQLAERLSKFVADARDWDGGQQDVEIPFALIAEAAEALRNEARALAELCAALSNLTEQAEYAMKREGGEGSWAVDEARQVLARVRAEQVLA